uniref:NHERF family PDZ scaffold protein 4 n=1 Tax=Prolemur simus TaxID=1328070 RepID=A0A8C8YR20_PROSS
MCLSSSHPLLCAVDLPDLPDAGSLTPKFKFNPKLGIDNPVLSLAEDQDPSDPWSLERPRFCLLSKEEGKSFGFHLQQERGRAGHVVCRVEPGTSAQHQGLQEGDRILGVNNDVVEHEDHTVTLGLSGWCLVTVVFVIEMAIPHKSGCLRLYCWG